MTNLSPGTYTYRVVTNLQYMIESPLHEDITCEGIVSANVEAAVSGTHSLLLLKII